MSEGTYGAPDWIENDGPMIDGPRSGAASGAADRLIVFLHGYGADGADLFGLSEPFRARFPSAAFAAPNAPSRSALNPMGYEWFPIPWIDGSSEEAMRRGFLSACSALDAYLDAELARHGLGPEALALVGFSQGTMMSLEVGPRRPGPVAGIVGFSGRLIDAGRLASAPERPPVALIHGDRDEVIPISALEETRGALAEAGFSVRWRVSRGIGHGIAPDGLALALDFLTDAFSDLS